MSEKKYRVACYCRFATNDQIDDAPLEAQSARLRRYADDNEKGLTMNRPGWYNVLSLAAREKVDAVLVTELGRVARDPWTVMETMKGVFGKESNDLLQRLNLSCNTGIAAKVRQESIAMAQI